jgi:cyclic pyranopterin phosphate synthase
VTVANATEVLGERPDGLDAVEGARFAGIQAAKQTALLIPLCHPIHIDRVTVDVTVEVHKIEISAVTEIVERTGVEMEALTACAIAALTLIKALVHADPEASIEDLTLWHKSGGRSGDWVRSGPEGRLTRRLEPGTTTEESDATRSSDPRSLKEDP